MPQLHTESNFRRVVEPNSSTATIAIAATFTAEPLFDSLKFWTDKLRLGTNIAFAPYNNVMQSLLDPQGIFATNNDGLNVVLIRFEDWYRFKDDHESNAVNFDEELQQLESALQIATRRAPSPMLVCICPSSSYSLKTREAIASSSRAEQNLARALAGCSTTRFISSNDLLSLYPMTDYHDPVADKLGHIPYRHAMLAAIGSIIARQFHMCRRSPYKVVALDCDETLWAGVCGENGPSGVKVDPFRYTLQRFMKDQKNQGMLLCICSKNNAEDVNEVFDSHSEMPLRREDIAAWKVNWRPKSENLHLLAKELNLGLDSFIFVDDNPMETAEVQANCPGVVTLTLPPKLEEIPNLLKHFWPFDQSVITSEDRDRTTKYLQNRGREQFEAGCLSYADFLTHLGLQIEIGELQSSQVPRAAQLTQRTNQFNLTTLRYTETDILQLMHAGDQRILTAFVHDRFGNYGQVGLIFYEISSGRIGVRNLLLSCRVLGKGVEHAMLARLGHIAQLESLSHVDISYVRTQKNGPARDFLETLPSIFREDLENGFVYRCPSNFAAKLTFSPAQWKNPKDNKGKSATAGFTRANDGLPPDVSYEWIAQWASNPARIVDVENSAAKRSICVRAASDVPRNELERQITLIWQRVMAISPIGVHENYFDLGGDSLMAVRIFVEIQQLLGRDLPLVTLLEAPTVAQLAELLGKTNWKPHWRSLVPIKSSGTRPPFYCVHGVGGNVIEFTDMTRYFHSDQPFYGIQAIGLDGKSCRQNVTVEQMAAHYISEIRELQPNGPYYLGGSSFGGLVAYEMARQLRANAIEVGMIALFDTHGPGYPRMLPKTTAVQQKFNKLRFRAGLHWSNLFATEPRKRPQYIWIKVKRCKRVFVSHAKLARRSAKRLLDRLFLPSALRTVDQAGHWAAADYVPGEYEGSITLFRATHQPSGIHPDRSLGWSQVVKGGIDIYDTPGYHGTLVREPRAAELVRQIEDALYKSQQGTNYRDMKASES